jgi:hypothetical protein
MRKSRKKLRIPEDIFEVMMEDPKLSSADRKRLAEFNAGKKDVAERYIMLSCLTLPVVPLMPGFFWRCLCAVFVLFVMIFCYIIAHREKVLWRQFRKMDAAVSRLEAKFKVDRYDGLEHVLARVQDNLTGIARDVHDTRQSCRVANRNAENAVEIKRGYLRQSFGIAKAVLCYHLDRNNGYEYFLRRAKSQVQQRPAEHELN